MRCRSSACRATRRSSTSRGCATSSTAGHPEAPPNPSFLLLHVNFGVPEEYAEGHIPGAHYLDTNWLEDPADWNRRSPEAIQTALAALGITRDTTVVLYGRDTEGDANEKWPGRRAGQIAATRALMILRYAGVDDVRLLDGGYDWWVQGGNPVETVENVPVPVASFGAVVPVRPEVIVDIDEAKEILADPAGAALVSVRTWREHIGNVSGYNYIGPAGRIKGDVWGNCGTDAYHMQHYRNIDNTMRAYPEIAANWAEAGITADKWVAFYCGTGWRASETWFYAYLQGWEQDRGLRRRLVRMEPGPDQQPDRDRRARWRGGRLATIRDAPVMVSRAVLTPATVWTAIRSNRSKEPRTSSDPVVVLQ